MPRLCYGSAKQKILFCSHLNRKVQFSVTKKGPIPFGTGPSPYIVRKLFNCINDCLKCLWLVECKVSQNLTVKSDTLSVHLTNKL